MSLTRLNQFVRDPLGLMTAIAALGLPAVRNHLGPKPFVWIFDGELAQEVLTRRTSVYVQNRAVFDRIVPVTGKRGLVQLNGRESQDARSAAKPLFQAESLARARTVIEGYSGELVAELQTLGGGDAALIPKITDLVLRSAFKIFLDVDMRSEAKDAAPLFMKLNRLCGDRMRRAIPLPLILPTPNNLAIQRTRRALRRQVAAIFATNRPAQSKSAPSVPVLSTQLHHDLVDHALTFLFAGHETTASSVSFTLLELARHPQWQARLATAEGDAPALLARACYRESLRLHPPAYMIARQAEQADRIGNVQVRRGDAVIVAVRDMHRRANHFPEPDLFRPERFMTERQRNPLGYMPFGLGPKSCLGERLALVEAEIIILTLCRHFSLELPPGDTGSIQYSPGITLSPGLHRVRLLPRAARRSSNHVSSDAGLLHISRTTRSSDAALH